MRCLIVFMILFQTYNISEKKKFGVSDSELFGLQNHMKENVLRVVIVKY